MVLGMVAPHLMPQEKWKKESVFIQIVLLMRVDVKNTFNSARWSDMLGALEMVFKIPEYLLHIVRDYLQECLLLYKMEVGQRSWEVTMGYMDDVATVISAHEVEITQINLEQVMRYVNRQMEEHVLKLAAAKTGL